MCQGRAWTAASKQSKTSSLFEVLFIEFSNEGLSWDMPFVDNNAVEKADVIY